MTVLTPGGLGGCRAASRRGGLRRDVPAASPTPAAALPREQLARSTLRERRGRCRKQEALRSALGTAPPLRHRHRWGQGMGAQGTTLSPSTSIPHSVLGLGRAGGAGSGPLWSSTFLGEPGPAGDGDNRVWGRGAEP